MSELHEKREISSRRSISRAKRRIMSILFTFVGLIACSQFTSSHFCLAFTNPLHNINAIHSKSSLNNHDSPSSTIMQWQHFDSKYNTYSSKSVTNIAMTFKKRTVNNWRLGASSVALPPSSPPKEDSDEGIVSNEETSDADVKVGVLLLNLGGPEKSDDVEGFLYNLFADPDIIRLPKPLAPLQSLIALFISKRRAPQSRAAYESIGGGSPILRYSKSQGNLVASSLLDRYGLKVKTYIGMRYWYPFTEEALDEIQKDGVKALVIVPLYPQFSISTSGSSLRVLQEEFAKRSDLWSPVTHTVIPQWYDRPGYLGAMANLILNELDQFTDDQLDEAGKAAPSLSTRHVLFSAHGVPQSYIEAGDPYQKQIGECVDAISKLILERTDPKTGGKMGDGVQIHLSYQSRVGPIEWLRPYTDDVLPSLGERGVKNLVVVPISFVSEHIETLEEIDIEYRELAEENGISNWRRCPALNTNEAFIDDMADMVMEALNDPVQTVTEACVSNNVGVEENVLGGLIQSAGVGGVGAGDLLVGTKTRLNEGERINGRIAILGVLLSVVMELVSQKPLTQIFGFWT